MAQAGGRRVLVIGGGLAGLSYAYYVRSFAFALNKTHCLSKITLLEGNDYMGGSIKSKAYEDGIVHELGPRTVRNSGLASKNTLALLEKLGLERKVLEMKSNSVASKKRHIYKDGRLHEISFSFTNLLSRIPASKKRLISAVFQDVLNKQPMDMSRYEDNDPSVYDFIAHRFGPEVAENLVDPVLRGITAGDARKLSAKAVIGQLVKYEQEKGSVLMGSLAGAGASDVDYDKYLRADLTNSKLVKKFHLERVLAFNIDTGLQTLAEHLCSSLVNGTDDNLVSIYNHTKVESLKFDTNHEDEAPCLVDIRTVDGDLMKMEFDHVVSAIPSSNLEKILPSSMPTEQREALSGVTRTPHAPVACVCVEYRNLDLNSTKAQVLKSFGFLSHSKSGCKVLGIAFDSSMFPEVGKDLNSFRMTCMIGGHWFNEVVGTGPDQVTDSQLQQIALTEIEKVLHITDEPHRMTSYVWKTGIAQYTPGHISRLKTCRERLNQLDMPLTLIGQSYDGFSVNDVIFASRKSALSFVESL